MEVPRTPAQWFALLAGAFLVALGVLTLVLNGLAFGETSNPADFLIWKASGWNTILWMAMGAIGVVASTRVDAARSYGLIAALVFGVLAVWGFIDSGYDTMGIFAIGTTGNITHAVIAGLGAFVALAPESAQRRTGVPPARDPHPS
ncbi:MAG: DUF4383 domain-containing protein [Actinomycetota bacterium]|nr:DUF4383 domain-containing protein [Actinomycetota bacterium]